MSGLSFTGPISHKLQDVIPIMSLELFFLVLTVCLLITSMVSPFYAQGGKNAILFGDSTTGTGDCFGACTQTCHIADNKNACNVVKALLVIATIVVFVAVLTHFSSNASKVVVDVVGKLRTSFSSFAFVLVLVALIVILTDNLDGFVPGSTKSIADNSQVGVGTVVFKEGFHTLWAATLSLFLCVVLGGCACKIPL